MTVLCQTQKEKHIACQESFRGGRWPLLKLKFRRTEKVAKDIECIGLQLNAWVVPEDVTIMNNNNTM